MTPENGEGAILHPTFVALLHSLHAACAIGSDSGVDAENPVQIHVKSD